MKCGDYLLPSPLEVELSYRGFFKKYNHKQARCETAFPTPEGKEIMFKANIGNFIALH